MGDNHRTAKGYGVALLYCRVSTRGQVKEPGALGSLETQEQECIEFAKKQGFKSCVVVKEQHSGAELWDRKVLTQVREDVKARKYEAVIAYCLDRLSRNQAHLFILLDEFARAGVKVLFATETLDNSPEGQLLLSIKSYVAAVEREKIRERTLRGKRARLLSGKLHNYGSELYGYIRDKAKGVRVINEAEADVVRRIFHDFTYNGKSISQIERDLNDEGIPSPGATRPSHRNSENYWHRKTIRRILTNPAYKGQTVQWLSHRQKDEFGRVVIRRATQDEGINVGSHVTPAILSPEKWDLAESVLKERDRYMASANKRNASSPALLRGMVYCVECGEVMYVFNSGKVTGCYYRCSSFYKPGMRGKCKSRITRLALLEAAVWNELKVRLQDEDLVRRQLEYVLSEFPDDQADAIRSCESTLAKIDKGQQRLVKALTVATDDAATMIERELLALAERRREVLKELDALRDKRHGVLSKKINVERVLNNLHLIAEGLERFDFQDRRDLLDAMSLRVEASATDFRFSFLPPTQGGQSAYVVSGRLSGDAPRRYKRWFPARDSERRVGIRLPLQPLR
ncbi:MAG TPA: recombinase family protein [Blastocatellia bacterium]|nr:recombinase family protein [Blastocatellia bacterium]